MNKRKIPILTNPLEKIAEEKNVIYQSSLYGTSEVGFLDHMPGNICPYQTVFINKGLLTQSFLVQNALLTGIVPVHKELLTVAVPVNKVSLTGTVPVFKELFTGAVPVNKKSLTRTVPVNKELLTGTGY